MRKRFLRFFLPFLYLLSVGILYILTFTELDTCQSETVNPLLPITPTCYQPISVILYVVSDYPLGFFYRSVPLDISVV
ncbi:MAG TPA: hypothetical protein VJ179_03495, partial [Patescibacteria group bacterium]|nr:hypothetical protein [Patescibacteria group bacterium]